MKRIARASLAALLPLLLLSLSPLAYGQDVPPGPTTVFRSSLPGLTLGGEFDLINLVLDFDSGAATPSHNHSGPGIAMVLTEEIVFGVEGKTDQVAKPGEFYLDLPGTSHTAANKTSSKPARVSYVVAAPSGAPLTTVAGGPAAGELPPGPRTVYRSTLPGLKIDGEFELINIILDFAPGAATPAHHHAGPGIATVIEGEIAFGVEGKADQIARPGDFYLDLPGQVHTAANRTSAPARISYVVVLPKGAALTTLVSGSQPSHPATQPTGELDAQLGMPRTGEGPHLTPLLLLALVVTVSGAGIALRFTTVKPRDS